MVCLLWEAFFGLIDLDVIAGLNCKHQLLQITTHWRQSQLLYRSECQLVMQSKFSNFRYFFFFRSRSELLSNMTRTVLLISIEGSDVYLTTSDPLQARQKLEEKTQSLESAVCSEVDSSYRAILILGQIAAHLHKDIANSARVLRFLVVKVDHLVDCAPSNRRISAPSSSTSLLGKPQHWSHKTSRLTSKS